MLLSAFLDLFKNVVLSYNFAFDIAFDFSSFQILIYLM